MSSTKSQVAVATSIPSLSSTQSQKDYSTEEPLGRQSSFGNNRRGNMKGKHLTRSHAMREATSPPRTPTPRAEHHAQVSPNGQVPNYQNQNQHHHHSHQHQQHADGNEHAISSSSSSCSGTGNGTNNNNNNNINNKLHAQSTATRGNSPIVETPAVIITSQHNQQHQTHPQQQSVAICNEAEFPKLTPPKSTKGGGGNGGERGSVNNQRNGSNCNSSNGSLNDGSVKIEYNNNNNSGSNCSSNGKKLTVDLKSVNSNNGAGAGGGGRDGRDHDNSHAKGNATNHKNHLHSQSYNNASIALHQALNIVDNNNSATTRNQQQNNNSTPIYNSGMNYQLHSPNHDAQHSQPHQQQVSFDKENRSPRNDSQNSNISNTHDDDHYERSGGGGGGGGSASGGGGNKKHRTSSNSKGSKPRLKNVSSSSGSADGGSNSTSNNTSGFISRENSGDQFTDHGGTDLLTFFKDTLNKNLKDRHILLKIEKDLMDLIQDKSRSEMRFPSASSYNRMLIHRTAAFFGMDHNVDSETQQCVIVAATKTTRVPEIRFKSLLRDIREDGRKSILKRDTHSFDEVRQSSYLCPDRGMLDRKAKSFEEREEDYERARSRIFSRTQNDSDGMDDNYMNLSWASAAEQQQQQQQQQQPQNQTQNRTRPNGKMLKMQTSTESRDGGRDGGRDGRSGGGAVPKAHSFTAGNSGSSASGASAGMMRGGDASNSSTKSSGSRIFTKQDSAGSTNTPWRLSPSSSGFKTQTHTVPNESVTPSPNGYASDEHTLETSVVACQSPTQLRSAATKVAAPVVNHDAMPCTPMPCGLVWAVTDISNVPKGSVLINPQTLQPVVNQDGSLYHFDPSNLPSGVYHHNQAQASSSSSPNSHTSYNQSSQGSGANMRKPKGMQMNQPPPQQHQQAASPIPPAHQQSQPPATAQQQPRVAPPSQQQGRNPPPTVVQQQVRAPVPVAQAQAPAVAATQQTQQPQPPAAASPTQAPQPKSEALAAVHQPVVPVAAVIAPALSPPCALEGMAEMSTQTVGITPTTSNESTPHGSPVRDNTSIKAHVDENASSEAELRGHAGADMCDNNAAGCLSITTTTSTKNFDRIEVQKFKNQATSPNIPTDKEEPALQPPQPQPLPPPPATTTTTSVATKKPEEPVAAVAANQPELLPGPARNPQPQPPAAGQAPTTNSAQQLQETPHSSRSTPFSSSNNEASNKRGAEETQPKSWTYTHSYQAPDGSTVFHTTTTPNSTPYCTTTYQQGPDGSVYAIPQGMVYAYPQQIDTGNEVQGYFMPVYDPAQQRSEPTAGLIPAGAQAIYQPTNSAAAATMVPVATAYPTAQFATTNGAQIFPGQVIYASEQFTPGGATVAAAAAPANAQLQQIPMTTYPISYSYPYNGCWGQTMTYYVPHHQALTGAVAAAPLMSAAPPPQQPGAAAAGINAAHVAGGVNLAGSLIASAPAAAGPSSNSSAGLSLGNSASTGGNLVSVSCPSATTTYQTHGGTTYFGTGRIKRPAAPHYGPQTAHHPQLMTTIPSAGGATTYQLGHAVPTLTLAAPANAGAASNDLNAPGAAPTATMYALPQHATIFPANVFPYATAAAPGAPAVQAHTPGGSLGQNAIPHAPVVGAAGGLPHAQQSTNAVITTPYYAQHPPVHHAPAVPTSNGTGTSTVHAPGPAAIPIVDPATLNTVSTAPPAVNANTTATYGGAANNSSQSQSAPSTPHALPAQSQHCNPPLFSTPPIVSNAPASGASGNGNYNSSSTSTTTHYYNANEHQQRGSSVNSTHTVYTSSYDKRHNSNSGAGGRKPPTYATGGTGRTSSMMNGYMGASSHKPALLGMYGERPPSSSGPHNTNNSYHSRSHALNKRGGTEKSQAPLLSAPPQYSTSGNMTSTSSYHANRATPAEASGSKPPVRLNAGAAAFRHKSNTTDFSRRSVSQRNSPGSNSNSNDASNHNSPNGMVATSGPTAIANCYTTSYVNNASTGSYVHSGGEQQTTTTAPTSLYIASRSHIPPQMQHGAAMAPANSGVGPAAATVMTASAADMAASMAAVNAAHGVHTQPLISYNTGHSGVYFKYVPTYNAHPSVALPNSRRSPSTDLRPQMAQMAAGIYPTVNMMIPAPPRHSHGRHTNPNYKGNRPR